MAGWPLRPVPPLPGSCGVPGNRFEPPMIRSASPPRRLPGRSGGGFTLLEIVIVIAIIALLAGGAIAALVLNSSKRKLQRSAGRVETLAKRARAIAILRQTPYALEFHDGKVRLSPWVETGFEDSEELAEMIGEEEEPWPEDEEAGPGPAAPVRDEFVFDEEMVVGVMRWGTDDWITFDKERNRMIWRFDPNGLCEPIAVRYELDEGESWLEQSYHPLTASVSDYAMEAK